MLKMIKSLRLLRTGRCWLSGRHGRFLCYKSEVGVYSVAAPTKRSNDDAWMVHDGKFSTTFAVADGVSSWRRQGINPALFSNRLVTLVEENASNMDSMDIKVPSPSDLISQSLFNMKDSNDVAGSCTICVGVIDKQNGLLHASVLGDTGILLMRNQEVIYKSKEQYTSKNVPYQLGINPQKVKRQSRFQEPCDAIEIEEEIMEDDVIMVATDGFFDNFWDDEILEHVSPLQYGMGRRYCLEKTAKSLAANAHRNAHYAMQGSLSRPTPFFVKLYGDLEDYTETETAYSADDVTICLIRIKK